VSGRSAASLSWLQSVGPARQSLVAKGHVEAAFDDDNATLKRFDKILLCSDHIKRSSLFFFCKASPSTYLAIPSI
jgi:hypothetical protein